MKLKRILIWLLLAGGVWGLAILLGAVMGDWRYLQAQPKAGPVVARRVMQGTWDWKLKTPWTDTKVGLYRANGQVVELAAKSAVYTVWSAKNPTNQHKGVDFPMTAFIDPVTRQVWLGEVDTGQLETNDQVYFGEVETDHAGNYLHDKLLANYLTHTNLYIQTETGILRGGTVLSTGTFHTTESLIKLARPGETLAAVIHRFEQATNGAWPGGGVLGESHFQDWFRPEFFDTGNLGAQETAVQHVAVAGGTLRLDFNSLRYGTRGSVWLDLKTLEARRAVEYRPVHLSAGVLGWGILPALVALPAMAGTLVMTGRRRSAANVIRTVVVLAGAGGCLLLVIQLYIPGAWPAGRPIGGPVWAMGDRIIYLPALFAGLALTIAATQAGRMRGDKPK